MTIKIRCEECNQYYFEDQIACWENQQCETCFDAWIAREYAYWHPLYDGEVAGGIHKPEGRGE